MNFFHNDSRSGYEEVVSYYPVWYPRIKEMDAAFRLAGGFLDLMATGMERTACNSFVMEMEEGVADRLLRYFGVGVEAGRSLEEKRSLLAALYDGNGKVSASQIKGWIKIFCGQSIESEVEFTDRLKVIVNLQAIEELVGSDVYDFLRRKIPAHLMLCLYGRYLLKHEVPVRYENAIRFRTAFHPRYNLPFLQLDRSWKLRHDRLLSGYDSEEVLDFYPAQVSVRTKVVAGDTRIDGQWRMVGEAMGDIREGTTCRISTEAAEEPKARELVGMRMGAWNGIEASSFMTKKNQVDAKWRLDGSRQLDGGRYIL